MTTLPTNAGLATNTGPLARLPGGPVRVVEFSRTIAGGYCGKLLADAGADVVKIEGRGGDPLRRWSATASDFPGDGALFQFLNTSKRSVFGPAGNAEVLALVAMADLVIEELEPGSLEATGLLDIDGLTVVSISPYGRTGPWANRPSSEFICQAESGCISGRGLSGKEPYSLGGRVVEFLGGTYAATAGLAALMGSRRHGRKEHVDVSLLEAVSIGSFSPYVDLGARLEGIRPEDVEGLGQYVETPSIEPTFDGWVGFTTNSRQQFDDFLVLIGRSDLVGDDRFITTKERQRHLATWNDIVHDWTARHTTEEVITEGTALRIPVAPVGNAASVTSFPQFLERNVFVPNPSGGFHQPRCPYKIMGLDRVPLTPVPAAGEHSGTIDWDSPPERGSAPWSLPVQGLHVLDMTTWFAGPLATQLLGSLGADVVHLESVGRIDGMRTTGGTYARKYPRWWECSPQFLSVDTNKRGLTLDLRAAEGRSAFLQLLTWADVLIENFTPRVMDNFNLSWDVIHEVNPRMIMVRMPAFGLDGPWRDWTGFAQTMEQVTGIAWVTGHVDDQPRIQRGPCDILSGVHAAYSTLIALALREATGEGSHVEATMVEAALNTAAEQIVEYGAYGTLMSREGNRSAWAAPQGLYPCRDGRWLAVSVCSDLQWTALCAVLPAPAWAEDDELNHLPGRRARHDELDGRLRIWAASRTCGEAVATLVGARIPAGEVVDQRFLSTHEQLSARLFFEEIDHPVVGRHPISTPPFRYGSVDRWLRAPAPTLGQDNRAILKEIVGLNEAELAELEARGTIGETPTGA